MRSPLPPRVVVVGSFNELLDHPWRDDHNAICWPRTIAGDFAQVARLLAADMHSDDDDSDGVRVVTAEMLAALPLDAAGRRAAEAILDDIRRLETLGRAPVFNCIVRYPRDRRGLPIVTDVLSFHVDRAPVPVDTWLCTYVGRSSEGLDNDDAHRRLDNATVREALRHASGCENDDEDFAAFVEDGSFDLHYDVVDGGVPWSCGTGHLWRIAVQWPGCPVPPCIHRAPTEQPGDEPRLLLIC